MKPELIKKYQRIEKIDLHDRQWPNKQIDQKPIWCSVDLRDGNQALINPMNISQKLKMYRLLLKIGFKEIEIGFPSAAQMEYDFMRKLIDDSLIPEDVTIQVLTQARKHLIDKTFESLKGVRKAIVHLYNSTATNQRKIVFRMDQAKIIELAIEGTKRVKDYAEKSDSEIVFQYSPESFTGTEIDFALEISEKVIDTWQPSPEKKMILNLPATVEMSTPNIYADQIEYMHRNLSKRDSVIISLHTHNDRGTAVAATELALLAGGDRVEGTLFGNGERTGNVDIVTVALNMYRDGIDPGLNFHNINEIIEISHQCTQIPVHVRHPYAGELVYTAFSGSHQDAISKGMAYKTMVDSPIWEVPYLPIDPSDLGRSYEAIIRINSQSGKGGVAYILAQEYGIELPKAMHPEFSKIIQVKADSLAVEIMPEQVYQTFQQEYLEINQPLNLLKFRSFPSEEDTSNVKIVIELTINGIHHCLEGQGNGPIDACKHALIAEHVNNFTIESFHEHSMGKGSDSKAIAFVQICNTNYDQLFGVGIDTNITLASIKALFSAINRSELSLANQTRQSKLQNE